MCRRVSWVGMLPGARAISVRHRLPEENLRRLCSFAPTRAVYLPKLSQISLGVARNLTCWERPSGIR